MSRVDPERPTRAEEQAPDPYVGRTFDGFRIDAVIGRGGMGVVYKATQLSLNRPVALKVLPEHVAEHPQFLERFHREVDVLSKLSHPNIVTVIDRGEVDGRPYLVMEYVAGTSLREVVREGSLPAHEALVIVRGVLAALEHAHDRGIIHRDIKPENVLVAPGGIVKVADFGLGRLMGPADVTRLTHTHLTLGTFEYMAPEQREKAKEADERADIYATGVVLYELIAGELPIGHFERLSAKRPAECDSRVDRVVERSLEKSPEKRFQRASEMGNAVSELLTPLPAAPAVEPPAPEAEPAAASAPRHGRSGRYEWEIGTALTALWLVPAWILSAMPWRNETVFWVAFAVGASLVVFARSAARHPRPRDDWVLGIGLTAVWVMLVCLFAEKPWRDEEILWLGAGALLSAFLIPRLKEAGKFLIWTTVVLFIPLLVAAIFWTTSGTDKRASSPNDRAARATPWSGNLVEIPIARIQDGTTVDLWDLERVAAAPEAARWVRSVLPPMKLSYPEDLEFLRTGDLIRLRLRNVPAALDQRPVAFVVGSLIAKAFADRLDRLPVPGVDDEFRMRLAALPPPRIVPEEHR